MRKGERGENGKARREKFIQIVDIKHERNDTVEYNSGLAVLIRLQRFAFPDDILSLRMNPFKVSLASSRFYCSWRIRYLRIESSQVVETPRCSEDEFQS